MRDDIPGEAAAQEVSPPKYLTTRELTHELRISPTLAYRLIQSGEIPSIRVGHMYRIPREGLQEALSADPRPFSIKGRPRTLAH